MILLILFALQGIFKGVKDTIEYHTQAFFYRFPRANKQFFDAHYSWRNKYKNYQPGQGQKFYGSTTFLVWLTDGLHLFEALYNISVYASVFSVAYFDIPIIYIPAAILLRWISFHITFNKFFK